MTKTTDTLKITQDEKPRDIFMSFGLLDALSKAVGSPEMVAQITLDPDLRDACLLLLLAERKKSGKVINEVEDLEDLDISVDDIEKLLDWAADHVMGFFMRSLQRVQKLGEKNKSVMESLQSFSDGPKA